MSLPRHTCCHLCPSQTRLGRHARFEGHNFCLCLSMEMALRRRLFAVDGSVVAVLNRASCIT